MTIFNFSQVQALPVTVKHVQLATRLDPVLSKVNTYIMSGWPDQVSEEFKPLYSRKEEIRIQSGFLMWGIRVILPKSLQQQVLQALHENHPGITRMKSVPRSYVWWNGMDKDIEDLAKSCIKCQEQKSNPPVAPLHSWVWPSAPRKRVHVDFAGPFLDKMFLILLDAHSKWPEVVPMSFMTTSQTIEALQIIFSKYG